MLSANELVAQVISFLILFALLRIFAWKKILALLDARKDRIASGLKDIEDSKARAAKLQVEYEGKLADIEAEARKLIQEAVSQGRIITDEVRKHAHEEAQDIIKNAKANIQHELETAKEELKDEIIDMTIAAAGNIIQEKLTADGDRKLVRDFLDRMDEANDKE